MTKIILIVASVLSIYIYNGFRNNKIISDTEPCQRLSEEVNKYIIENIQYRDVDNLNGRAAIIGDSLLILARSNRTAFFAFEREQAGFYSSWKDLKDVLPSLILASCIFVYNDQIVYIGINQNWEEAIYIYDREFKLIKEMQFELKSFSPDYRYNNWLYGASQDAESRWGITKVNLDTLETETISLDSEHAPYGICRNYDGAIMFAVSSGDVGAEYFQYKNQTLTPLFQTAGWGGLLHCDYRGLFYLEGPEELWDGEGEREAELKLWDGHNASVIATIETADIDEWLFRDLLGGSIIIEDDFFISIHDNYRSPYLLIHSFDSSEPERIELKEWNFTESDMDRNGDTYYGIFYDNGSLIRYFYSKKAGGLETEIIKIKER